jgi:D-aminopeptidase
MAVGRVFDGAVAAAIRADARVGDDAVAIPLVAECDDSWLSDARTVQVEAADSGRAVGAASGGPVPEGAVGAGTGMVSLGYKGGIGTASRLLPRLGGTLGVLVLANFGARRQLRVDGVPVGQALPAADEPRDDPAGSCIAVLLTDVPLGSAQLARVARRAGLGLARTGSVAHHGSGEIAVAVSTAARRPRDQRGSRLTVEAVPDEALDEAFAAAVEATEEAVVNALFAAPTTTGRDGRVAPGLPREPVLELLRRAGRLAA